MLRTTETLATRSNIAVSAPSIDLSLQAPRDYTCHALRCSPNSRCRQLLSHAIQYPTTTRLRLQKITSSLFAPTRHTTPSNHLEAVLARVHCCIDIYHPRGSHSRCPAIQLNHKAHLPRCPLSKNLAHELLLRHTSPAYDEHRPIIPGQDCRSSHIVARLQACPRICDVARLPACHSCRIWSSTSWASQPSRCTQATPLRIYFRAAFQGSPRVSDVPNPPTRRQHLRLSRYQPTPTTND
ncbi:hypothetical protein B0H15DRAFT_196667 [Mycena belliarum]|uniref:Uncharacterized protein n=1 Tax=Mycena belliarum TaxID=1033014 RepID=A0AAD6XXH2_9AGAR|nr:hypothetical protein B0H15DRAFT_196667 [Mycena belliae]